MKLELILKIFYYVSCNDRLSRLHWKIPEKQDEIIKIEWSEWKAVREFLLPHKVLIGQAGKLFEFEFTKIEINNSGFKKVALPVEYGSFGYSLQFLSSFGVNRQSGLIR